MLLSSKPLVASVPRERGIYYSSFSINLFHCQLVASVASLQLSILFHCRFFSTQTDDTQLKPNDRSRKPEGGIKVRTATDWLCKFTELAERDSSADK